MNEGINVVSCFDGIASGYLALQKAGIKVNKYFSIEIDKHARKVAKTNFPNIIELGDIRNITKKDFQGEIIDLILAGSPCQGFSFAGKQLAFDDPRSKLFFEFVRLKNELKPKYFLLENVEMKKNELRIISEYMGIFPQLINSNLVSAQNRSRFYWSNICTKEVGLFDELYTDFPLPKDKGLVLNDILQPDNEIDKKYYLSNKMIDYVSKKNDIKDGFNYKFGNPENKTNTITARYGKDGKECLVFKKNYVQWDISQKGYNSQQDRAFYSDKKHGTLCSGRADNKCNVLIQKGHGFNKGNIFKDKSPTVLGSSRYHNNHIIDSEFILRKLTPVEVCRLQTIPDDFFYNKDGSNIISDSRIYSCVGNGWTIDIIFHLLSFLK